MSHISVAELKKANPGYIRKSMYGPQTPTGLPAMRAADLPGMVALPVQELFPDVPKAIYVEGDDLAPIRKATEAALANVNMDMIKPRSTVNILTSQYGFMIMGGWAYREMVKTIKEVVEQRTGCERVRLRIATGFRLKEPEEIIEHYELDKMFNGKALPALYIDQGIEIDTPIGPLMGIKRIYDADFIIHAHHGELRELDMHRMISRTMKPFSMSYARFETRCVHHMNFGPRSSNLIPRLIYESPFVQKKFTFGIFMAASPQGVTGIEAGNDLMPIDRKLALLAFKSYGKIRELYNEIKDCVCVMDGTGEPRYMVGGGTTFGNLTEAELDLFDLDAVPVSLGFGLYQPPPTQPKLKAVNPAIRALVMNHFWTGVPQMELATACPMILVGQEMAKLVAEDCMNIEMIKKVVTSDTLPNALDFAKRITGTDKVIAFDGAYGAITCSESLAELLIKQAPVADRRVEEELMPKWLRQRGFDPSEAL
ncbi:MAG: hypothetical protein KDE22_09240 [Rhodobacterales bacterium]|nr:hypothetical protein [Rhodobacterales bacterium]